jgi:hypothetical protein
VERANVTGANAKAAAARLIATNMGLIHFFMFSALLLAASARDRQDLGCPPREGVAREGRSGAGKIKICSGR